MTESNPPLFSLLKLFDHTYDGLPAAWLPSAVQAHNLESMLRAAGKSYKTKIHKSRKSGRQFIVMLVEAA